jgi:hypothetical protein
MLGPAVSDQALTPNEATALDAGKTACKQTGTKPRKNWKRPPSNTAAWTQHVGVNRRHGRTNDPLSGFNTNTLCGRRITDLARKLLVALGNPTDTLVQAGIIQAAELSVLAEELRTEALNMEPGKAKKIAVDQVIRLQGHADRAYSRLGFFDARKNRSHHKRRNPLTDYLGEAAK